MHWSRFHFTLCKIEANTCSHPSCFVLHAFGEEERWRFRLQKLGDNGLPLFTEVKRVYTEKKIDTQKVYFEGGCSANLHACMAGHVSWVAQGPGHSKTSACEFFFPCAGRELLDHVPMILTERERERERKHGLSLCKKKFVPSRS